MALEGLAAVCGRIKREKRERVRASKREGMGGGGGGQRGGRRGGVFGWRWLYFKKVSSQMRNRILGRRSLTEGRVDSVQPGGESEKQKEEGGRGLGCTIATIVSVTNDSNRSRAVYGFRGAKRCERAVALTGPRGSGTRARARSRTTTDCCSKEKAGKCTRSRTAVSSALYWSTANPWRCQHGAFPRQARVSPHVLRFICAEQTHVTASHMGRHQR